MIILNISCQFELLQQQYLNWLVLALSKGGAGDVFQLIFPIGVIPTALIVVVVQGEWVSRHDVCLHDKLYTWIILIVILIIVLLIILLVFLIYFTLDSCVRHITDQENRRKHRAVRRQYRNQISSQSEDSSYCNSDDSYIYGKNLSLGDKLMISCNILFNLHFI